MKLLGHAWVAINSKPEGKKKLLILGSILPEIMYYTKDHPFEFEEIHEGGEKVLQYLKRNKPGWLDLGIGMITHSARFGVDKFNLDENFSILGCKDEDVENLQEKLTKILKISKKTAKNRTHNILELAVELKIIKENPDFVYTFNQAIGDKKVVEEIKRILTDCFNKTHEEVSESVDELLRKAKPSYFTSAEGLASLWSELISEYDPSPNKKQLTELLLELSKGYSGRDDKFLKQCITWTKSNLKLLEGN